MARLWQRSNLLRFYRAGIVAALGGLIYWQGLWFEQQRPIAISLLQARRFFPTAERLTLRDPERALYYAADRHGTILGCLLTTSPQTDDVIGYSGPNNLLIVLDATGTVVGLELLESKDTPEHVKLVRQQPGFLRRYLGWKPGTQDPPKVAAVSGATLTSYAIAEATEKRLSGSTPSLRFPEPITVAEVQAGLPSASRLENDGRRWRIVGTNGNLLGYALRTSPEADNVAGYRGPTEALVILQPDARTVHTVLIRQSYDTESYVKQVRSDRHFLQDFQGRSTESLAGPRPERVGGVSGATQTSRAIAEGIRRRLVADARLQTARSAWKPRPRDWATWAVVLGAIIMAFTDLRGRKWIRIAWQAVLIGYLGLISGDLISLALLEGWSSNGLAAKTMPGLIVVAGAALFFPLVTRRQIYCHHLCPHGAAQHWLGALGRKMFRRQAASGPGAITADNAPADAPSTACASPSAPRRRFTLPGMLRLLPAALLGGALFAVLLGGNINLSSLEAFDAWSWRAAGLASIAIAIVGLVASLFIPQAYCRFGCPTGSLLAFLRSTGSADRWGARDWSGLVLLGSSLLVVGATRLWPHPEPVIEPSAFAGPTMGTTWSVKVRDELGDHAALQRAIAEQFEWAESMTSHWRPNTDVSDFNRTATTNPLPVPWPVITLARWSEEISRASDGAFDITIGPLVRLWGFGPGPKRQEPPADAEVITLLTNVGWQKLEILEGQLRKKQPRLEIDLSAIAKGWAVDQVVQMLEQRGLTNFLVEAGGELRVRGTWLSEIEHPGRRCSLTNEAIATSGTYRQKFTAGTNQFSHLLDPHTGKPITHGTVSVSVRHAECARADAWATALNVLGAEKGLPLADRLGLAAQFVVERPNGILALRTTKAWK